MKPKEAKSKEYGGCWRVPHHFTSKVPQGLFWNMWSFVVVVENDILSICQRPPFFLNPCFFKWWKGVEIYFQTLNKRFHRHPWLILPGGKQSVYIVESGSPGSCRLKSRRLNLPNHLLTGRSKLISEDPVFHANDLIHS